MAIIQLLGFLIYLYSFVVLARVFMSWIPNLDPYHPVVQLIEQLTDPVLEPARRLIPPIGMIDISATVVMLVLWFIANALMGG